MALFINCFNSFNGMKYLLLVFVCLIGCNTTNSVPMQPVPAVTKKIVEKYAFVYDYYPIQGLLIAEDGTYVCVTLDTFVKTPINGNFTAYWRTDY